MLSVSLLGQETPKRKVLGNEAAALNQVQLETKLVEESTLLKLKKLQFDKQMQTLLSVEETLALKAEIETIDQAILNNQRIRAGKAVQLSKAAEPKH